MEVACLFIHHFAVRLERQGEPALQGKPVIIVDPGSGGRRVLDASEEAQGITAGMLLSQAQSRCPEAIVVRANPPLYQEAWSNILEALEGLCPAVEDGSVGCAYGDIGGLASFYRGEDRVARALLSAAPTHWGVVSAGVLATDPGKSVV